MANHQTRYFVSAYLDLYPDVERLASWTEGILQCLDRVRWFVPTEAIDEFCFLWQLESQRTIFLSESHMNVAPADARVRQEAASIVSGMPELYSIDLLFWQIARARYASYKHHLMKRLVSNLHPNNWGQAWLDEEAWIWLGRGWFAPETYHHSYAWWAGPQRVSEIRIKKRTEHRYLVFTVIVFCGVYDRDVALMTSDGQVLNTVHRRLNENEVIYVTDLEIIPNEATLFLVVPEVAAPIMMNCESEDISRKSIATCNWRLMIAPPIDVPFYDQ